MEPVAVWVRKNGEWAIIHRCRRCGAFSSNRVAADDNPVKLMSIAMKPIGNPPFPIERMAEITEKLEYRTNAPGHMAGGILCLLSVFVIPAGWSGCGLGR